MTKHIHFIGICGVAMSALAIAFQKQGWRVSGSDAGFYPPISTLLREHGIYFYPGWHPEKMGAPNLAVVGNVAASHNPEWLAGQKNNIPYRSYPEVIAEYVVKANSIVAAGTYGKTTTSALLSWVLAANGRDPSYMFGGLALNDFPAAHMGGSGWSVLEGDEYKTARWDNRPKFAHYRTTHLLLTALSWDHADLYPTEESYFAAFRNLIAQIPPSGLVVAGVNSGPVRSLIKHAQARTVTYGQAAADYVYSNVSQSASGLEFTVTRGQAADRITSPLLGDYQAENITGVFALASETGLPPAKIITAIASFPGLKRRLERRLAGPVAVFDDIAHSPAKAKAVFSTLRQLYPGKIIAVFEPNTGNRRPAAAPGYEAAFQEADEVIVPKLTALKRDPNEAEEAYDGGDIARIIGETHPSARYIPNDPDVVAALRKTASPGDVIVFAGSHGFRGMIEGTVRALAELYSNL